MRHLLVVSCLSVAVTLVSAPLASAEAPAARTPDSTARAAALPAAFAVGLAVRGAIALARPAATRGLVAAGGAVRAAAPGVQRLTRSGARRIQRDARRIARGGRRYTKRNWNRFGPEIKACASTYAFMTTYKFLRDNRIDRDEWSRYVTFGPRLVPPLETFAIDFPIEIDPRKVGKDLADEVLACAIGAGFARYYDRNGPTPQ